MLRRVARNCAALPKATQPCAWAVSSFRHAARVAENDGSEGDEELARLEREAAEEAADRAALRRYAMYGVGGVVVGAWAWWCNGYANSLYGRQDDGSVKTAMVSRGKPSLGGPFTLVSTDGTPVSQAEFLGQWTFFYFGFVHCPEICPVELNRMTKVVNAVKEKNGQSIKPMFVSCDPKRDSLDAIEEYLSVFHPDFVGLVGTPRLVDEVCKSYRIYYSLPDAEAAKTDDYLIDHSIAIFLFDPQGRFVDFFGNRFDEHEMAEKVITYMGKYDADPGWTNY